MENGHLCREQAQVVLFLLEGITWSRSMLIRRLVCHVVQNELEKYFTDVTSGRQRSALEIKFAF